MMQAVDSGSTRFSDDTLWLFLADNGGMPSDGGFNVPLRGHKATAWEGDERSQTFLHWSGFASNVKGSVFGGLAHVSDWGVTLTARWATWPRRSPGRSRSTA